MNNNSKRIALAASAIVIFAAGMMGGIGLARPNQDTRIDVSSPQGNLKLASNGTANALQRTNDLRSHETIKLLSNDPAQEEIMRHIRDAMLLPQESRNLPLLKALEETTKLALSKELLDSMRSIIDDGEIESSHYVLSLMEQREEKSSVDLLLHAATHQNPDVADRALFALEAIAGTVFKNREEATAWSAAWQPNAERLKLFGPKQESESENTDANEPRMAGPRAYKPKVSALKSE